MSSVSSVLGCWSALDAQRHRAMALTRWTVGGVARLADRYKSVIALGDQAVVSITTFATAVMVGRVCGKAELGVYTLAWTIMTMATEISAILTTTPYTVFRPQLNGTQRRGYLGSILVHQLILAVMFGVLVVLGGLFASVRGWIPHAGGSVIAITAVVTLFCGLREFARRVSFAELKIGRALAVDVIASVGQMAGMLVLFRFGGLTSSRSLILLGATSGLAAGGWMFVNRNDFCLDTRMYARDLERNWSFAKWVLASGILSAVVRYLFPWVLAIFHGTSVTGTWAACIAIVAMGNPVVLGLGNHVFPQLSNIYAASGAIAMQRQTRRSSLLFIGLLLPIVLILAVYGDALITAIYGIAYAGNGAIIRLLALNMLIAALANPYSLGLFTINRARADTLVNVFWVTLMFTVGIAAVRLYAAVGGAAAMLACCAITAILRFGVFEREVHRISLNTR